MASWTYFFTLKNEAMQNHHFSIILLSRKYWNKPKLSLEMNTVLLMGGHVPLAVVILKDFTLYPSSKVKKLSNGTQQVPLGTFAQSAKIHKVWV